MYALAGALGGVQSHRVPSYDEARCTPSEAAHLIAVRTQQVLQYETGIPNALPLEEIVSLVGVGGNADAIGPVACWLASDEALSITGQLFTAAEGHVGCYNRVEEIASAFKDGMFTTDEILRILPLITTKLTNPAE